MKTKIVLLVSLAFVAAAQDRIPVFIKPADSDGFVNPDKHQRKAIQDSTADFVRAVKESSPMLLVDSEKDAMVVLAIVDRGTTSRGYYGLTHQNKSTLIVRLTVGTYTTDIKAESGMKGQFSGYNSAAKKAVKLIEEWITANRDRIVKAKGNL